MNEKIPGVYIIGDVTSHKSYVGSSNDLNKRIKDHARELDNNHHANIHLQRSYNAGHQFTIIPIPTAPGVDPVQVEQQLLDEYFDTGLLLNIARDATAPNRGISPSEETREKMRIAMTGFKHSDETRQKLSEIAKERGMPRAVIEAGAASRKGKSLSPEHIEKVRETSKARMTPEARANLSEKNLGIPHTPETIALMKEKCKGRTFSPTAKAALQKYHEDRRAAKDMVSTASVTRSV